jgi:hypothetical protein
MRRLLAFVALVSFLPTANAQDKGKAEFSPSAEFRARYNWAQNGDGTESNESNVQDRMKFGANYKANEKLSAHATVLHAATFGQDDNAKVVANTNDSTADNVLMVNEAYANWMFSDDLSFKFGRQTYQIADGSLIAVNDWEQNPTAFEGLVGNWEAEFGRFQLIAFKQRELGTSTGAKDGEHNLYGLNFDLKTMPNWLKSVNVHVLKDNADAKAAATTDINSATSLNGLDVIRYGAMASFNFQMIDLKLNYEGTGGKIKTAGAGNAITSVDAKGTMMQAEVGAKFDGFMGSRVFVAYHQDSGAKNGKAGDAYDNFFYEKHDNAGLMDLVDWGNLTYLTVGLTLKPGDNTDAGIMWHNFSRTEKGAGTTGDHNVFADAGYGDVSKDAIGNEIDVWGEHRYDGGLSTVLRVGYFTAGDYLKNHTPKTDENILQVMVEGKLTF